MPTGHQNNKNLVAKYNVLLYAISLVYDSVGETITEICAALLCSVILYPHAYSEASFLIT